jgi:hypothetical protein
MDLNLIENSVKTKNGKCDFLLISISFRSWLETKNVQISDYISILIKHVQEKNVEEKKLPGRISN